jgi:hypothetical protein
MDQVIAERAQSGSCRGRDASRALDVQHDVDVVGWSHDAQAVVGGVQLGHQSADQGPLVRRQHRGDLGDVPPRVRPSAGGGGDVDDGAFDARMPTV